MHLIFLVCKEFPVDNANERNTQIEEMHIEAKFSVSLHITSANLIDQIDVFRFIITDNDMYHGDADQSPFVLYKYVEPITHSTYSQTCVKWSSEKDKKMFSRPIIA